MTASGINVVAVSVFATALVMCADAAGPASVLLGRAASFAVLAKDAISTSPPSDITGHVGVSPAAGSYLTGFSETLDSSNVFSTSTQVVGKLFASDYASPTPADMTTTISDMEIAYTDASSRAPDSTNLNAGELGGLNLAPGVYNFGTDVTISTDLTLTGNATDSWIFQISGTLIVAANKQVILAGGALADNIVWQSSGYVEVGAGAHVEGTFLAATKITLITGSSLNGRIMAQTHVALQSATIVKPGGAEDIDIGDVTTSSSTTISVGNCASGANNWACWVSAIACVILAGSQA